MPLGDITSCMVKLTRVVAPGGRLFATVFHYTQDQDWSRPIYHERGGITTYPARDPYHYRSADLKRTISDLPWTLSEPMDWDHPKRPGDGDLHPNR